MHALIVGNSEERIFQHAAELLRDAGVGFTLCADVYGATAEIALSQKRDMLIIGSFEELSKEQFGFFSVVSGQSRICCCIAQEGTAELAKDLIENEQADITVAKDIEELEKKMARFGLCRQKQIANSAENRSFIKDDIDVTRDELDALLGTE